MCKIALICALSKFVYQVFKMNAIGYEDEIRLLNMLVESLSLEYLLTVTSEGPYTLLPTALRNRSRGKCVRIPVAGFGASGTGKYRPERPSVAGCSNKRYEDREIARASRSSRRSF